MTIEEEIEILKPFIIPEHIKEFSEKYTLLKFGRIDPPHELLEIAKAAAEDTVSKQWKTIIKQNRKREFVDIRSIYCAFLRQNGFTYQSIANSLNRHHASIIYSVKTHSQLIENNQSYIKKHEQFTKAITRHRQSSQQGT